jgi:hypothetical protein
MFLPPRGRKKWIAMGVILDSDAVSPDGLFDGAFAPRAAMTIGFGVSEKPE